MDKPVFEMHENINENQPIIYHVIHLDENIVAYPNWHDNIEFLCFIDGKAEVFVDSACFNVAKNDIIVVNSGKVHTIRSVDGDTTYHCLIVDKEFCKSWGFDTDSRNLEEQIRDNSIEELFERINTEMMQKEKYYESAVKYLVCDMLVRLYRYYRLPAEQVFEYSGKSAVVKKAATFIDKNCVHGISIDDIAVAVNVSKYYLCRIFKEIMGITMVEYANFSRCKKAYRMLDHHDMNVSEVAEACGFENMSYFSKIYKKYMNILPSEQKKIGKAVD